VIEESVTVRTWFAVIAFVAEFLAALVSQFVLYERVIVPLLPTVTSVPSWWWVLAAAPLGLVAVVVGWYARSVVGLIAATFALALGSQICTYWASITSRPGYGNQPLAEADPLMFWTIGTVLSAIIFGIPCAAVYFGRRAQKKTSS
jgi:hypothetical protein